MRHASEVTRDTIPLLSATNDTNLTDTKIDKCGVSFFVKEQCVWTMNYQKLWIIKVVTVYESQKSSFVSGTDFVLVTRDTQPFLKWTRDTDTPPPPSRALKVNNPHHCNKLTNLVFVKKIIAYMHSFIYSFIHLYIHLCIRRPLW